MAPGPGDRDEEGRFDRAVWQTLADNGSVEMPIPEQYGGSGGSIVESALADEASTEGAHNGGLNTCRSAGWRRGPTSSGSMKPTVLEAVLCKRVHGPCGG